MKKQILSLLVCIVPLTAWCETDKPARTIHQVDFSQVTINDSFWSPRLEKHASATLPVCIDQIENQTGRMQNFINAGKGTGGHSGIFFDDSDVYKAMEGMAYSLVVRPDADLEAKLDEWVNNIAGAQQDDGYINTYFTLTDHPRWTDMDKHEMYCAGHLIEAGIAYYKARGKDKLLNVGRRMADHMMTLFGPDRQHWVAGHEEIELALVKLYEVTGEKKYLDFAHWLLEERGHGYGSKGDGSNNWNKNYYQDSMPVKDLRKIGGHAVRAMYLFCGMADVASYIGDTDYMTALDALWHNTVDCNMYVTGGIGSSAANEGFTHDYDLPNATAYCETCASVGMVLWNHRMNLLTGEGKYADVLERSLYNALLAGVNLAGNRFFYVNPLESDGNHHRQAWFGTACCPSNLSRFLPSLGNYIYGTSDDALWVNLYIGNEATLKVGDEEVKVTMTTSYPWEGTVTISLDRPLRAGQLRLRIPAWCKSYSVSVGGQKAEPALEQGYAVLSPGAATVVELTLDMPIEVVTADERVVEDLGCRAIQRGPLVYCAEMADNSPAVFSDFRLTAETTCEEKAASLLGGIRRITATTDGKTLRMIPYYAWDNRTAGKMMVWLRGEDYEEYHRSITLSPSVVTHDWGYQYGNLVPLDTKNDGQQQLFIAGWFKHGTETPRHSVLLEPAADGTWKENKSPFNVGDRPSFSPCDIDGDGNMDLIVFEQTGNTSDGIYRGNGNGTFTKMTVRFVSPREGLPRNYTAPMNGLAGVLAADIADFNNDGLTDLVCIGYHTSPTAVLLNQGITGNTIKFKPVYFDNGITDPDRDRTGGAPYPGRNFDCGMVFAQDFNNDGYADILISANNWERQNYGADWERFTEVYLNSGDGTSFTRTYFAQSLGENADDRQNPSVSDGGIAIADYNGDGCLDIFLQGSGGYFSYYWDHTFVVLGDGTGHFAPMPYEDFDRFVLRNWNSTSGCAQAYDWDGDGLIDIIYQGWSPDENTQTGYIWQNNTGSAGPAFRRVYRWAGGSEAASCLVDWDGDGRKDLFNIGKCEDGTLLTGQPTGRTTRITLSQERITGQPAQPRSVSQTVKGDSVTLSWTPADGAPQSTTYELYIRKADGVLLGCPRAYLDGEREGQRKCEDFGKQGCATSVTYTLPDGRYEWGVQAVDGRRTGSKFTKGTFTVGQTDGISAPTSAAAASAGPVYDLQGRPAPHPAGKTSAPAIYVINGRKFAVQ